MHNTIIKTSLLTALLVCGPLATRASVALGDYTVSIGTNVNLWDFSGSYTDYLVNVPLEYTIAMDPSGKFTGSGTGTFSDDPDYLNFTVSLSGTTRTAGNLVRVSLSLKMKGSGQVEGYDATFSATAKCGDSDR